MATLEMFFWWYAHGWGIFIKKLGNWMSSITDFFSMDSLLRTLFKPYRQISAERAGETASLDLKFHMFLDRLISRLIGFFSRLVLLIVGIILIVLVGIFSLILIVFWPLIPFLPIAGIVLSITGFLL